MTAGVIYALAGVVLFGLGLHAVSTRAHLLWKVLALNVLLSGTFLVLVGMPPGAAGDGDAAGEAAGEADMAGMAAGATGAADPVPQAMVLTGIVVAVSATALALRMVLLVAERTGKPYLPEEPPE